MAKPSKAPPNRVPLSDGYIKTLKPREEAFMVWDMVQLGLGLRVQPTGTKTFKVAYYHQGRLRWYTMKRYGAIGLADARDAARQILAKVTLGQDPQGDKMDARIGDTLEQIHQRYLETKARNSNKSWRQADKLMKRYVLPKLGKRKIKDITRRDMWEIFDSLHEHKVLANCVLASASAVFNWALKRHIITENPCRGIEHHKVTRSARFLSNDEIRLVWSLFDTQLYPSTILKLILLTAQRPGEVCAMRWEHLDLDTGLWSMPGAPTDGWPGTKNKRDHEIPLTEPVLELLRDLEPQASGHVFPSSTRRGKCISIPSTASVWKVAGIPRFRPHDLRATAATGMDALGIIRQHIALVLNHVDSGITASYVRHDKREHKRAALQLWATELTAIQEGEGRTDQKADVLRIHQR